jgi:putative photosynthetic complex assembly protein 2
LEYIAPLLFALGTWWLSTVVLLWRSQRAEPKCAVTMAAMSVAAVLGLLLIIATRDWTGPAGAYLAFVGGLALWAWHEMSYFLGSITGPRPEACPPGKSMAGRFAAGVKASLWHELAIIFTALGLIWLSWDSANPFAALTFVTFWLMRWSAKLNIFFGVRNLHEEFWPEHMHYLSSYVKTARMNAFFPVSMLAAGGAMWWMISAAMAAPLGSMDQIGWTLVGSMLGLAILEHILLFLSVPDAILWKLATGQKRTSKTEFSVKLNTSQGS